MTGQGPPDLRCPVCGSRRIVVIDIEVDDEDDGADGLCLDCRASWHLR